MPSSKRATGEVVLTVDLEQMARAVAQMQPSPPGASDRSEIDVRRFVPRELLEWAVLRGLRRNEPLESVVVAALVQYREALARESDGAARDRAHELKPVRTIPVRLVSPAPGRPRDRDRRAASG